MKWKKELPTEEGYYWCRNLKHRHDSEPRILYIREYCGKMALGNSALEGWNQMEESEWAGPVPLPTDEA